MFPNESKIDSLPNQNFNSDNKEQNEKTRHFFSDQEIESLISTDFSKSFLKIDQTLRKAKDDFVEKVKDDLIEYLTSKTHVQKNELDEISVPSTTQETSNNYFSQQEEEQQLIEEEEEASIHSNNLQDNISNINEEENQNEYLDQSDKIPSAIFNSVVDEEEEERSKFEFEDISQIPQDLPPDELSQIEKVKHYGSVASDSQIGGEEELHSINFPSSNNDDIGLSPIGDNKSDDNHPDEVSSASHISGGNGFDDFESDALINDFND